MTYQEQAERYHGSSERSRYDMCIREQAHATFANDADPNNQSLAYSVIRGEPDSIDSLMAAICVGPNSATLSEDGALLSAVQTAWPSVAVAVFTE